MGPGVEQQLLTDAAGSPSWEAFKTRLEKIPAVVSVEVRSPCIVWGGKPVCFPGALALLRQLE